MDRETRDVMLAHAQTMLFRVDKLREMKDLPPLIRLYAQSTHVSIEKLIQAIHDGR